MCPGIQMFDVKTRGIVAFMQNEHIFRYFAMLKNPGCAMNIHGGPAYPDLAIPRRAAVAHVFQASTLRPPGTRRQPAAQRAQQVVWQFTHEPDTTLDHALLGRIGPLASW